MLSYCRFSLDFPNNKDIKHLFLDLLALHICSLVMPTPFFNVFLKSGRIVRVLNIGLAKMFVRFSVKIIFFHFHQEFY